MKAMNFVIGFISGAAIGATCGLLFAPEKGSDLREKIAEALRKNGRLPKRRRTKVEET